MPSHKENDYKTLYQLLIEQFGSISVIESIRPNYIHYYIVDATLDAKQEFYKILINKKFEHLRFNNRENVSDPLGFSNRETYSFITGDPDFFM